jgi:hypothetical protein
MRSTLPLLMPPDVGEGDGFQVYGNRVRRALESAEFFECFPPGGEPSAKKRNLLEPGLRRYGREAYAVYYESESSGP